MVQQANQATIHITCLIACASACSRAAACILSSQAIKKPDQLFYGYGNGRFGGAHSMWFATAGMRALTFYVEHGAQRISVACFILRAAPVSVCSTFQRAHFSANVMHSSVRVRFAPALTIASAQEATRLRGESALLVITIGTLVPSTIPAHSASAR